MASMDCSASGPTAPISAASLCCASRPPAVRSSARLRNRSPARGPDHKGCYAGLAEINHQGADSDAHCKYETNDDGLADTSISLSMPFLRKFGTTFFEAALNTI